MSRQDPAFGTIRHAQASSPLGSATSGTVIARRLVKPDGAEVRFRTSDGRGGFTALQTCPAAEVAAVIDGMARDYTYIEWDAGELWVDK